MRIAFIDLVYSWPPLGGAPLDLHHTVLGLQRLGHDVNLFFATDPERWDRGELNPATMPIPATRLDFTEDEFTPEILPRRFREAVDAWKPDVVFICFGFFIKPFVAEAFADYPTISRYYAYEPACPRDYRIYKNGAICPENYLTGPDVCRRCTLDHLSNSLRSLRPSGYVKEYLATKAFTPAYHRRYVESLKSFDAIVVYNEIAKAHFAGIHSNIHVIGGGVQLDEFPFSPMPERPPGEKKVILMTGRTMDEAKGMKILERAGQLLWKRRQDFEIWVTHGDSAINTAWLKNVGWQDHRGIVALYKQADIGVVPSVWEEPFGLVAIEAMAAGRPVCVARVGGLQKIPRHGETGFVYDAQNPAQLADYLDQLLADDARRKRMGEAARRQVEEEYTWDRVIEKHYPPLLEGISR